MSVVQGHVAPGFESVAQEFERNFAEWGDVGAAFAAYRDGELVVDLYGGVADSRSGRPWVAETPVMIFSGTKALTAVCVLLLLERGQLELDAPVARYWPEFAAHGKASVTVAEVASHRSRLPAVRAPLTEADLADPERLAALLAGQAPERDPRCELIYHGLTYGWLLGELVRRIDGRTLGQFFAEEVAAPLGLDVWIGLPPERLEQVAVLEYSPDWGKHAGLEAAATTSDDLLDAIYNNPVLYPPDRVIWNAPALQTSESPAANGIGTPRSIARLLGCLARGGEIDGVRLLAPATVAVGRTALSQGDEPICAGWRVFGVGFQLQPPDRLYGPPPDAFGHTGAGGSLVGAWPAARVGYSYAMNVMRTDPDPGPRAAALTAVLHACLRGAD